MIVWGGYFYDGSGHYLKTGARYNPSTHIWTATSTRNAPDGRDYHTAVWTGTQMIVWGGYDSTGSLNTGGKYCAAAPSPTPTPTTTVLQRRRRELRPLRGLTQHQHHAHNFTL